MRRGPRNIETRLPPHADAGQLVGEKLLVRVRRAANAPGAGNGTAGHTGLIVGTLAGALTLGVHPAGLRRRRDALAATIVGLGRADFCRGRTKPAAPADADGSARPLTLTAPRGSIVDAPLIRVRARAAALTGRIGEAPTEGMAPALDDTVTERGEIAGLGREWTLTAAHAGGVHTARGLAVAIRPGGIQDAFLIRVRASPTTHGRLARIRLVVAQIALLERRHEQHLVGADQDRARAELIGDRQRHAASDDGHIGAFYLVEQVVLRVRTVDRTRRGRLHVRLLDWNTEELRGHADDAAGLDVEGRMLERREVGRVRRRRLGILDLVALEVIERDADLRARERGRESGGDNHRGETERHSLHWTLLGWAARACTAHCPAGARRCVTSGMGES